MSHQPVLVARRDASFSRSGGGFASKWHRIHPDDSAWCNPDSLLLDETTRQRVENVSPSSLCRRCFPGSRRIT